MPDSISTTVVINRQVYRQTIERLRDTGNYFPFYRDFLLLMTVDEALVLQSLMNTAAGVRASKGDGWFRCTVEDMTKTFHGRIDRNAQTRILNSLVKRGYIRYRKAGVPPKRHIWIDVILIEEELTKALENAQFSQPTSNPVVSLGTTRNGQVASTHNTVQANDTRSCRTLYNSSLCSEDLDHNDKRQAVADAPVARLAAPRQRGWKEVLGETWEDERSAARAAPASRYNGSTSPREKVARAKPEKISAAQDRVTNGTSSRETVMRAEQKPETQRGLRPQGEAFEVEPDWEPAATTRRIRRIVPEKRSAAQDTAKEQTPPSRQVARPEEEKPSKIIVHAASTSGHTLLPELESTTSDAWEVVCARRLMAVVKGKLRVPIKSKAEGWAKWFLALDKEWERDHIDKVLTWYEQNWTRWRVRSAEAFRNQFAVLEDKMARDNPEEEPPHPLLNDPVVTSIVDEVKTMGWPKGSGVNLPDAVARSYEAMTELYDGLWTIRVRVEREGFIVKGRTKSKMNELVSLVFEITTLMGMNARSATTHWFQRLHGRLLNWATWSGDLKPFCFSLANKSFRALLHEANQRYGGRDDLIPMLLDALGIEE